MPRSARLAAPTARSKLALAVGACLAVIVAALSAIAGAASPALGIEGFVTYNETVPSDAITLPNPFTVNGGRLVVAFIATGGPENTPQSISSVTGGGLSWRLAARSNSQAGTSEVWTAWNTYAASFIVRAVRAVAGYEGSMSVIALSGAPTVTGAAATAGAQSGAPSVRIAPTKTGSWIWAVGNDWDRAVGRQPGSNQSLVAQYLNTSTADTFWTQRMNAQTSFLHLATTLNDAQPTTDRWNLAAVEIIPGSGPAAPPATTTTTTAPPTTTTSTTVPPTTTTTTVTTPPPPPPPPPPGSMAVRVSGNHLVDAAGAPLTLRGANASGTEFVCAQNWSDDAYGGQPFGSASTFQAMTTWHVNVVRIPLNEDCWLNINGVRVGGAAYQQAIAQEVAAAHQAGLYAILDLHWNGPGSVRALSQQPAPDLDHSPLFWQQVASAYRSDPAVVFDLYNEPFDYWGTNSDKWAGWLNGDTQTQYMTGGSPYTQTSNWKTAGMQQLVDTVRATGATNALLVNGMDWANDDSGWLAHAPVDPQHQIIAGAHIYPAQGCSDTSCWDRVYTSIAASYPVLIGETGDSVNAGQATFIPGLLNYADAHHWNYLAWTWNVWGDSANVLIKDWAGTPTAGEGVVYRNHLMAVH